jgi:hypothetical protein
MESIAGIIKLLRESGIHIFLVDGKLKSRSAPGSMTPALGELIRKTKSSSYSLWQVDSYEHWHLTYSPPASTSLRCPMRNSAFGFCIN